MKTCSKCKVEKSFEDFGKAKDRKDGHRPYCNQCRREYRKENIDVERNNKLRKTYGITLEEYNQMFLDQNGCCSICHGHQTIFPKALCVDHCHKTGIVRGLLCHNCNTGIGLLNDSPELMAKAIDYLKRSRSKT